MKHFLEIDKGPKVKRCRKNSGEAMIKTRAILAKEFYEEPKFVDVYTGIIKDKRNLTRIIKNIQPLLPMKELQHLKRINQNEIILCFPKDVESAEKMPSFLRDLGVEEDLIEMICESILIKQVPVKLPMLHWQNDITKKHWPSRFLNDEQKESLFNNTNFSEEEQIFNQRIINVLFKLEDFHDGQRCLGICVDPRTNSIVAIGASHVDEKPFFHSPMVLIDNVARTQGGGAYTDTFLDEEFVEANIEESQEITLRGIPKIYYNEIKNDIKFTEMVFGAEVQKAPSLRDVPQKEHEKIDNLVKYGPYICTGYSVYLSQEPCMMCAMALLHSRVKRIFFVRSSSSGCLMTKTKLQECKALNHHFQVFQCYVV